MLSCVFLVLIHTFDYVFDLVACTGVLCSLTRILLPYYLVQLMLKLSKDSVVTQLRL